MTATVYVAALELRRAVPAADRSHGLRASLFLRVDDADGGGWGECATAIAPGVDATLDEVVAALDRRVLDAALTTRRGAVPGSPTAAPAVASMVSSRADDLAAASLVDAALLDRRLRRSGRSLVDELGVDATSVGFAGVVGVEEPGKARDRAVELVELGATRVRVKVSAPRGTEAIAAVIGAVAVPVVADANGTLRPGDDDAFLLELCDLPLAWVEQPYAAGNLAAHATLAGRVGVDVALDESVRSLRAIRDIARYGAATVLCVKPVRLGGVAKAQEARAEASRLGLRSYVGGYFEAGLGRAVLGALAACHDDGLDGDVVAPSTYLVADPCALRGPEAGRQPLHVGAGCGSPPDPSSLTELLRRDF